MPRHPLFDFLQNHRFLLYDITWEPTVPPWALSPLAGFASVSAPSMTIETEDISEGNAFFPYHAISSGTIGQVTLTKGVSFMEKDFWNWIVAVLKGDAQSLWGGISGSRRNLLLIQLTSINAAGLSALTSVMTATAGAIPSFEGMDRLPGQIWILEECIPVSYKATGDLDATNADISIQELVVQPESFRQL